jgi:hypothetical protein
VKDIQRGLRIMDRDIKNKSGTKGNYVCLYDESGSNWPLRPELASERFAS